MVEASYSLFPSISSEPDDGDGESEDQYPVRAEEYTKRGQCGHFDPETMDNPCARDGGWGREGVDDGRCKQHHSEVAEDG